MKIFIINLKRSLDRRIHIIKEMDKLDLDYEFIEAVDGRELTDDELREKFLVDNFAGHHLWESRGRGIAGCALSHQKTYKEIVKRGIKRALILEDDIILSRDIVSILKKLDTMQDEIAAKELILFWTFANHGEKTQLSSFNRRDLFKNYSLMYPMNIDNIWSAVAYSISLESAKMFLDLHPVPGRQADKWAFFYEQNIFSTISCVTPFPVNIGGVFESDIGSRFQESSMKYKIKSFLYKYMSSFYISFFQLKHYLRNGKEYVIKDEYSPADPSFVAEK